MSELNEPIVLSDQSTKSNDDELAAMIGEYQDAASVEPPKPPGDENPPAEAAPGGDEPPKKKRKRRTKAEIEAEKQAKEAAIGGEVITGLMLVTLIDLIFPLVITFLHNRYADTKIRADKLKLKKSQINELEPIANELTKQLELKGNPMLMFVGSLVGIYGLNYLSVRDEAE